MDFTARRQEIIETLRVLGDRASVDAEYYAALSDYVERFEAIRDEVNAMDQALARGESYGNSHGYQDAVRRHHDVEARIRARQADSPQYKQARDALESAIQRLHQLNSEEFSRIAEQRNIAPGPLIFANLFDTLAAIKREVDSRRR